MVRTIFAALLAASLSACATQRGGDFNWGHKAVRYCESGACSR